MGKQNRDDRLKSLDRLGSALGMEPPPPASQQRSGRPPPPPPGRGRGGDRGNDDWVSTYLKDGYFYHGTRCDSLREDLVTDVAQRLATAISQGTRTGQVRQFFAEVRKIEAMLRAGAEFDCVGARLARLEAAVENRFTRGVAGPVLRGFIIQNSREARRSRKHFVDGFVPHFEAVVAYLPKERG